MIPYARHAVSGRLHTRDSISFLPRVYEGLGWGGRQAGIRWLSGPESVCWTLVYTSLLGDSYMERGRGRGGWGCGVGRV